MGAFLDEKLVGLAILRPDAYGSGEARFNGAYVLPKFREKRIGSALMKCHHSRGATATPEEDEGLQTGPP